MKFKFSNEIAVALGTFLAAASTFPSVVSGEGVEEAPMAELLSERGRDAESRQLLRGGEGTTKGHRQELQRALQLETDDGCVDDPNWVFVTAGGNEKGCAWVGMNPEQRCDRVGEGARPANWACLESCGICSPPTPPMPSDDGDGCDDDVNWVFVTGGGNEVGCAWVAMDPDQRCGKVGEGARPANWACLETCGLCSSPTPKPTPMPTDDGDVCADDVNWVFGTRGGNEVGCAWVAMDPDERCDRVGEGARPANWACLETCGIC